MKKQVWKFSFAASVMFWLSVLYFFWQPFPKGFVNLSGGQGGALRDVLSNLLYFLIEYTAWLWIVGALTEEKLPGKRRMSFYMVFLLIQLLIDLIQTAAWLLIPKYAPIVSDVCLAFNRLLMLLVLDRTLRAKLPRRESLRLRWILAGLALLGVAAAIGFDLRDLSREAALRFQYRADSAKLTDRLMNMQFRWQWRGVLLDAFLAALVLAWMYYGFRCKTERKPDPRIGYNIGMLIFRQLALSSLITLILVVKLVVMPQSLLFEFLNSVEGTMPLRKDGPLSADGNFGIQSGRFTASRMGASLQADTSLAYVHTNCGIVFDGAVVFHLEYDGDYRPFVKSRPGGDSHKNLHSLELPASGSLPATKAAAIAGQEIAWFEDGTVRHMDLQKLARAGENHCLTEICKGLIRDEQWEYFEACSRYLMKWAPEEIRPTLELYAESTASGYTQSMNPDIRYEYVQETARTLLAELNRVA